MTEQIRTLVVLVTNAYVGALGKRRSPGRRRIGALLHPIAQPTATIIVVFSRGTDDSPRGFRAVRRESLWLDDGEEVVGTIHVDADTRDMDIHDKCAAILAACGECA